MPALEIYSLLAFTDKLSLGVSPPPSPSSSSLASQGQDVAGIASVSDEAEGNSPPSVSRACVCLSAAVMSS